MPELPEVETIAAGLRQGKPGTPAVIGLQIVSAQVLWSRTIANLGADEFQSRIVGQIVSAIGRRGKFLVFDLSQAFLLLHLRMSGDVVVVKNSVPPRAHDRVTLMFDNGFRLAFNDPRKFGRIWLTEIPGMVLGSLGPEPLDESLTSENFYQNLHTRKRQLKPLLLDQTFLAGIGNIYADEALHLAKIHPLMRSDQVSQNEAERLLASIRRVLTEGIQRQGASIDWVYRGGSFQNYFRVYRRTGLPCMECGATIERIIVGQRASHYCPVCQAIT